MPENQWRTILHYESQPGNYIKVQIVGAFTENMLDALQTYLVLEERCRARYKTRQLLLEGIDKDAM